MKLRFFVCAYGAHVSLYEAAGARSMLQPRNRAAIGENACVSLYSDLAGIERLEAISAPIAKTERHVMEFGDNPYANQTAAFLEEVKRCVQEDAVMVMLSPDNFWGDGSLPNLLAVMGDEAVCVAVPHPRVTPEFLDDVGRPGDGISGPIMVRVASACLHPSWCDADLSQPETNSFYTGIGWRDLGDVIEVRHLQPTVFLARLTAADYGYLVEHQQPGIWDHIWPSKLVQENRLRVVTSSDMAFIVEITDPETHNTAKRPVNPLKPMEYCRTAPHIEFNRGIVSTWRR